ncbi:MAG: site-specific integrase [Bacteroidales bacterium]|jgi:integrase|nr:site-specific integrase [Bacteroidales bacterium]
MATIYLTLSEKSDTLDLKEIRVRFKHGKIDQQAKTNIFINPDYWDNDSQKIIIPNPRVLTPSKTELKQYLTNQSEKLTTLISVIQTSFNNSDKKTIDKEWLKTTIDKHNFPERYNLLPKALTLFQFIDKFIEESPERKDNRTGRFLSSKQIYQYKNTETHLRDFAQSIKKKDFSFLEIDQAFYDNFVGFLQKKSLTQNTVGKHIKVLKIMLNAATFQKYNTNDYFSSFHVFKEETDNVYLNEDELTQLKNTDFSDNTNYDRVRDWFLLLAWTCSRFSDLDKITKSDVKDGLITFRQQKTNTKVTIPLHPVVVEILEKYNYNMPEVISNQQFNEDIKEVCKIAKINSIETMTRTVGGKLVTEQFEKWEHVSTHTGRRSFCTNMTKRGLPAKSIMSVSGHKTERSFMQYLKMKQNEHAELIKREWEKIY